MHDNVRQLTITVFYSCIYSDLETLFICCYKGKPDVYLAGEGKRKVARAYKTITSANWQTDTPSDVTDIVVEAVCKC